MSILILLLFYAIIIILVSRCKYTKKNPNDKILVYQIKNYLVHSVKKHYLCSVLCSLNRNTTY